MTQQQDQSSKPPINFSQAIENLGGDEELFQDVARMTLDQQHDLMQKIRTALSARDSASVATAAHTLKGVVSTFCASALQAAVLSLENAAKQGMLTQADELFQKVQEQMSTLSKALTDYLQE